MAVTVNATGSGGTESGNVTTFDYTGLTTAAGSNTVIVLVAVWDGTAPSDATAIWDPATANQSMGKRSEVTPDAGVTVFGLRNPTTTGNKTIRLTWTGACRVFPTAIAFDGCDVSNDAAAFPHQSANVSTTTVSVTSATGNKVVAGSANNSSPSGITGTTIFGPSGGFVINAFANYDNGAATVNIGSTTGGNRIAAVDIAAFAGSAANPNNQFNWPVPRAPDHPISLRTWINDSLPLPLFQARYIPSRVTDWGYWSDPRVAMTWTQGPPPVAAAVTQPQLISGLVTTWDVPDPVPFQPWQPPRNFTLLSGPPQPLPKNQYSWPLPTAPLPAADLRTFINDTPIQLIGKDRLPFRQKDWPLPTATRPASDLRTFINDLPFQLIGKDKLPIRQQSWPVPIAPDYSISLRSFLARPSLPLLAAPVVTVTYMPGRVSEWGTWERIPFIAAPLTNLTLSLPEAVVVDYVFRVASFAPRYVQPWPDTWIPQSNITLRPPGTVIVANLLPCRVIDWGYAAPQTYAIADLRRNTTLLAGPAPQKPFNQTDWPLTPAARQPDRTFQRSFPPELIGQDRLPFRQQDWPLSIAAYYDTSLRTLTVRSILTAAAPIQPPFAQDDWPVPSAQRQADRTFQQSFPQTLIGQDRLPVRQQSWPLTPATEFVNALRSIGFRSPALDVAAPRPFVQSDWPVPTAARPAADLRTHIQKTPIQLIGKDRLPIRQQDWPLPIAPRPAADLRTYIAQSPIRLIGKDRLPFRQRDWPVPRAHLEFHTLRSITQGRVIYGGEVAPIPPEPEPPPPEVIHSVRAHADAYYGVFYADEIKGRADFSRAKGSNDEEAAN